MIAGHRRRSLCETLQQHDTWRHVLRAADGWRDSLIISLSARLVARAAFPSDAVLATWGANDLDEYMSFREGIADELAEVARHQPAVLLAVEGGGTWQRREAGLFGALATMEVVLSRVLSIPGQAPSAEAHALSSRIPPLLHEALLPPTAHGAGDALMLQTRCRMIAALAPWLASPAGSALLPAALGGILPCVGHAAFTTAEEAVTSFAQLTSRCDVEIAASPELVHAAFAVLAQPIPAVGEGVKAALVGHCARLAAAAPAQTRLGYAEALLTPLLAAIEAAVTALEGGGSATLAATIAGAGANAVALAEALEDAAAAVKALRGLGREAAGALLPHLVPPWVHAAGAAHLAPSVLHVPLSRLGSVCVTLGGASGRSVVGSVVGATVAAMAAAPAEGAPLIEVADAVFEAFCMEEGMEASFTGLVDELASHALPVISGGAGSGGAELATAILSHCDKVGRVKGEVLAAVEALPSLVMLAARVVERGGLADEVDAGLSFLSGVAWAARVGGSGMHARLARMGTSCGEAVMRACVLAVEGGVEMALVPQVADVLAPALGFEPWRAHVGEWLGVGRAELVSVLVAMPDACPHGRRLVIKVVETLRQVLEEWANVARVGGAVWEVGVGVWEG